MQILVTGGLGAIGSNLTMALLKEGHYVTVLDDLSTGQRDNLTTFYPTLKIVEGKVENESLMEKLVKDVDVIFHLAAAVGVNLVIDKPVESMTGNLLGSEVVFRLATKYTKRVIFSSTSEVYAKSTAIPFKETGDIVLGSPEVHRWSYACAKAADEFLGMSYRNQYGLRLTICRLFNTVSPNQTGRYGMVIPKMVMSALRGQNIQVYGSGKQTRCFAHVDDVVTGFIDLMECPEAIGQIFNIGNDEEVTISDLAYKIKSIVNPKASIEFVPYNVAYGRGFEDMPRRVPDLIKIKTFVDYEVRSSLNKIISDVAAYEINRPA